MTDITLPKWAQLSLWVTYSAGRAGPGWGPTERRVRLPFPGHLGTTVEAAEAAFERAVRGEPVVCLPEGVIPDYAHLVIEARPEAVYPWAEGRDVFRTLARFARVPVTLPDWDDSEPDAVSWDNTSDDAATIRRQARRDADE